MNIIERFLNSLPNPNSFKEFGVYEKSLNKLDDDYAFVIKMEQDYLVATGNLATFFIGETKTINDLNYVVAKLSYDNMRALRTLFPFTKPVPVLREKRSFGLGDRLGLAGEGHLNAIEAYDAFPILAQQSMRELTLTNRTYEDVLNAASLAVFKFGFKRGFGADGDHLKTAKDIKHALDLGFSMITLDTSDYIRNDVNQMSTADINDSVELTNYEVETYLNKQFTIGEHNFFFDEETLKKSILIYRDSINYSIEIYNEFFKDNNNVDFELSIDETATPTELNHHFYIANELNKNNVKLATIAPRFHGEFQKGIDYIGDINLFEKELKVHVAIAEHFGYKLSIHSGSDKFSIFEIIGRETKGHFHVKTAGTNWLEAVKVVAIEDPILYRNLHKFALSSFNDATKLYHVTTNLSNIPNVDTLKDHELVDLFDNNDARQLLHITYGHILTAKDDNGNSLFGEKLFKLWHEFDNTYANLLEGHIGKHLELLYKGFE
ncbi:MAG TPA: hypothetical protein GX742_01280 [Acholeplasmataceae bacterium]|nr:hypothetical protein [Acholeplasmataceae bacterium]